MGCDSGGISNVLPLSFLSTQPAGRMWLNGYSSFCINTLCPTFNSIYLLEQRAANFTIDCKRDSLLPWCVGPGYVIHLEAWKHVWGWWLCSLFHRILMHEEKWVQFSKIQFSDAVYSVDFFLLNTVLQTIFNSIP